MLHATLVDQSQIIQNNHAVHPAPEKDSAEDAHDHHAADLAEAVPGDEAEPTIEQFIHQELVTIRNTLENNVLRPAYLSFAEVRQHMINAMANESLRQGYQANIAMLLSDRYGITDPGTRNAAADDLLELLFPSSEVDPRQNIYQTRRLVHIQAGSPDWEPTVQELQGLVKAFSEADVSAQESVVVATRADVKSSELKAREYVSIVADAEPEAAAEQEPELTPIRLALVMHESYVPPEWEFTSAVRRSLVKLDAYYFNNIPVFLQDRAVCDQENVLAVDTLQLLPYAVLRNRTTGEIFSYARGKGGAEARLIGNLSVGVGGHVDGTPGFGQPLLAYLAEECSREIQEEVGLKVHPSAIQFTHLIHDETNDVGSVHMGIVAIIDVDEAQITGKEPGVIDSGAYISLSELLDEQTFSRLESWSQVVVQHLSGATIS